MKNFYFLFFIVLSTKIYSQSDQVSVKVVELSGSRFGFVDKKTGTRVNELTWESAGPFINGFSKISVNHQWGFVNGTGQPVIRPRFTATRNFINHRAAVRQNSKWGFIDEKGIMVIPAEFEIVYDFTEMVTAVYKEGKWSLLTSEGVFVKTLPVRVFWGFHQGLARIEQDGREGLMNTKGEVISLDPPVDHSLQYLTGVSSRSASPQAGSCPLNVDFESGSFSGWNCYTGSVAAVGTTNQITVSPSAPTPNRHVIYPRSNLAPLDPYGLFPVNPPDGSNFALKLGNDINGAEAERVSYRINLPSNPGDASITYRYAVVFQDPGHEKYEQPRFSARVLDVATNRYLNCASYEYISDSTLPGFYNSPLDDSIKCKTWASIFINLSAYAGKSVVLEFTTADCTRGRHWGYAYVDVGDCGIAAKVQYQCNPSQATFTAPPGFRFYNWWNNDFSTLLANTQTMILSSPQAPGSTLHLEVIPYNGSGCSDTLNVPYNAGAPVANAGPDRTICEGNSVELGTSGIGGFTYTWTPADFLSDPASAQPSASPPGTTEYYLNVINKVSGCSAKDTVLVTVHPTPAVDIGPDVTLLTGTEYPLNAVIQKGAADSWKWSPPNDISCTDCPDPTITVRNDITYQLLVKNSYGCPAVDSIHIKTFCVGSQVFIPNAFTPDGDGLNDVLMVRGKGIQSVRSFRIFTRWGELVFEKTNFPPNTISNGWDGKIKGRKGPAEVYVYTAEVICDNLQTYTFKGNTTLLQ